MGTGPVVVTGLGVLTALGEGRSRLVEHAGPPSVAPRSFAPYPGFPALDCVRAASLPPLPIGALLPPKGIRALSEDGRAALCAAVLACREAGIELATGRGGRETDMGVALGTMRAGLDEYALLFSEGVARGPAGVTPSRGPRTGYNTPASEVSIFLRAAGPNLTVTSGAASAGDAIAAAADLVRDGEAPSMLSAGVDLLSYMAVHAERTLDPAFGTVGRPMPFDRDRAGAAPGEAAVALVLEDAGVAAGRGAAALAELVGAGAGFAPTAKGAGSLDAARRALEEALDRGRVDAGAIDAVVASACGYPRRDATEARALVDLFGDRVPVCSVGGATGDCAGATAAVQVAVAIAALGAQRVPATSGFRVPDPRLGGLRVTRQPVPRALRLVVTLTVDGAGHASAILLRATGGTE